MSTLIHRDLGPDKEAAEMTDSDEAGHANAANLPTVDAAGSPAPAEPEHFADRRRQHAWVPASAALLTMLIGLSDIIAIFKPGWPHRLHKLSHFVPGTLTNVTRTADVIIGLMLLLLAHALHRRKRRAWQAVLALLAFDIGIHFYHKQHVPTAVVAIVLVIALLYFRDEFYAEGDQRNRWRALWAIVALVVADVVIGLTYILLARGLATDYSFSQRVWEVITGLVGVSGPVQWSPEARGDLGQADAARVRELLAKHGDRDSLGYFALRNDKSVIWSPTGKAAICYRVVSGVMLASGDPIGDPEAWPGAITPFMDEAARHAWAPAVMGCSELGAEVWCREGHLTALELGDEGLVGFARRGQGPIDDFLTCGAARVS